MAKSRATPWPEGSRERTGEHYGVAIEIAEPEFPVSVLAQMAWSGDHCGHLPGSLHGSIELLEFEPQDHAIAIWLEVRVAQRAVTMLDLPPVQLQHKSAVRVEALVLRAAMTACATEKLPIPAAAGLDISDANERCQMHGGARVIGVHDARVILANANAGARDGRRLVRPRAEADETHRSASGATKARAATLER